MLGVQGCTRRGGRVALFDGIEEGWIKASSSHSRYINELDNESALTGLEDRVSILKRVSSNLFEFFQHCDANAIFFYLILCIKDLK